MPLLAPEVGLQLAHDACAQDHLVGRWLKARSGLRWNTCRRQRTNLTSRHQAKVRRTRCQLWEDGVQGRGNASIVGNNLQLAPRYIAQRFDLHKSMN